MNSEEAFRNYWEVHWKAMLARAMGDHCHDKEEASLYRTYVAIKEAEDLVAREIS